VYLRVVVSGACEMCFARLGLCVCGAGVCHGVREEGEKDERSKVKGKGC
jgi:hypothetical protein